METGGYNTRLTSVYANNMIGHYNTLFQENTMEETFKKVKHSLDLCAFGMILYGIMLRNPFIKNHHSFIMNLYKMKNAKIALKQFKTKTRKK